MASSNNQKGVSTSLNLSNIGGGSKNGPVAGNHHHQDQIKSGIVGTSLNGPLVTISQNNNTNYNGKSSGNTGGGQGNFHSFHQIYAPGQHQSGKGNHGSVPMGMVSSNKFATQEHGHSRKTHSQAVAKSQNKNRNVHQSLGSNPLAGSVAPQGMVPTSGSRAYNSVGKGQNGRKGQQSHQSSYFSRGSINANYLVSASHDGNFRHQNQSQASNNNNANQNQGQQHGHGHGHLIKSYDTAAMQQQRGPGNSNRDVANNSAMAVSRENSLNRRATQNASNLAHGQIHLRQKNNSQNSMHQNDLRTLQQRGEFLATQTPQGNYHQHAATIDHDSSGAVRQSNQHRRGNSNHIELGRSPQKHAGVSLKYANQQYGKSGDLAAQRANARTQISGPSTNQFTGTNGQLTGGLAPSGNNLVTHSLDPVKLQIAKRKASNDDSRFKNKNNRYGGLQGMTQPNTQNLMAPYLDQSLDTAAQMDARVGLGKHMIGKDKSRQEQSTALTGDHSRPKTSTGMRGNGIFQKINGTGDDMGPSSILPPQQNSLPTKTNFTTLPSTKATGVTNESRKQIAEKNEGLRSQLRRSYDANSGNLPHAYAVQPAANVQHLQKLPNRPHSSNKMNQVQRQTPQQISTLQQMAEKPKGNRKRDFSKVVDITAGRGSDHNQSQSTASNENSRTIDVSGFLNRQEININQPQANPQQFSTIQPPSSYQLSDNNQHSHQQQQQQSRDSNNTSSQNAQNRATQPKKQHLRSLTSHKLQAPSIPLQIRKEDMHHSHQRDGSNKPNGVSQLQNTTNLAEITEGEEESNPQKSSNNRRRMPSEERQSRHKPLRGGDNNNNGAASNNKRADSRESKAIRASITREVTTSKPINQPQGSSQPAQKKFDNCVTKFSFATKTGFSPKNPNKVNQDSYLVLPHLGEYRRTHFFSVCDGHGVFGKEVSDFVKTRLGQYVEQGIKTTFDQAKVAQRVVDSTEVKEQLHKSFSMVQDTLFRDSKINLRFSGSTCVSVLIVGTKIFCANVGDSRAVLVRQVGQSEQRLAIPLNRDHKADEPDEEARILRNGGRVQPYRDMHGNPLGPLRVWHLKEDIPGLAMTRSFGDQAAAQVGVIASPEILEMNLIEGDQFIILASDGVWEFISNEEAANIIMPHYQNNSAEKAAEAIIKEAIKRWQEEDTSIDDITCIIIFLSI